MDMCAWVGKLYWSHLCGFVSHITSYVHFANGNIEKSGNPSIAIDEHENDEYGIPQEQIGRRICEMPMFSLPDLFRPQRE